MKDKKVTIEEQRQIQLEILKEVDRFCRKNGLKYFLACGTLIGAIRHKGFIPWDDDIDIVMPLPDIERFKKEYKSDTFKFCDIDTQPHYEFAFPRICYLPTYNKIGINCKSYGVNIDVYSMLGLPSNIDAINEYAIQSEKIRQKRVKMIRWRQRIIRRLPIKSIPFFDYIIRKYTKLVNKYPYKESQYYYCSTFPPQKYYDIDYFEELIDVEFEGLKFYAPKRYHEYLTYHYGDYMKLPPEEKRKPYHGGNYYWRKQGNE